MKKEDFLTEVIVRYFLLLAIGIFGIKFIYYLVSPLTIYPIYLILNLFYDVNLSLNTISINNLNIELIEACIAVSAYYLLFILNISTPNINMKSRLKILLLSFGIFLTVNIFRILLFSVFFINGFSWFDFAHELSWYFLSVFFVVGIWFYCVKIFKIKSIPIYSDLKMIYKLARN